MIQGTMPAKEVWGIPAKVIQDMPAKVLGGVPVKVMGGIVAKSYLGHAGKEGGVVASIKSCPEVCCQIWSWRGTMIQGTMPAKEVWGIPAKVIQDMPAKVLGGTLWLRL